MGDGGSRGVDPVSEMIAPVGSRGDVHRPHDTQAVAGAGEGLSFLCIPEARGEGGRGAWCTVHGILPDLNQLVTTLS